MSIATMRHGGATSVLLSEAGWIERLIAARTARAKRDVAVHVALYSDEQLKRFGLSHQHIRTLREGSSANRS